jgi:hypothetical protein
VVKVGGQTWVIELKVSYKEGDNEKLAIAAMDQILKKRYGQKDRKPILLGLVINDNNRAIKAWKCQGALTAGSIETSYEEKEITLPGPKPQKAKRKVSADKV